MSCTSATACAAVGAYTIGSGDMRTLTYLWDGTTWTQKRAPTPILARELEVTAVSCASATACAAVGHFDGGEPETVRPFFYLWDGSTWTRTTAPLARREEANLNGVSCVSPTSCVAVGEYWGGISGQGEQPLTYLWDGATWTRKAAPAPTDAETLTVSGVSCASATSCAAVGHYRDSSWVSRPLTYLWDGTAWTRKFTPIPTDNEGGGGLVDTSCTAANACAAVGYYQPRLWRSDYYRPMTYLWNGTIWTRKSLPAPDGVTGKSLRAVSCNSATACTAVGDYVDKTRSIRSVTYLWDGTAWAQASSERRVYAQDVSCVTSAGCVAVGSRGGLAAIEAESGP